MRRLFVPILLSVLSCAPQGGAIPDSTEFKKTMKIKVNGKSGRGMLVVDKASKYKIKIDLGSRSELVKLSSCHREYTVEKSGWSGRREHTFEYTPVEEIELNGFCPIFIGSFDKSGGHEWAMIEIRNRSMKAISTCNGVRKTEAGVSLCQSRAGLLQMISFPDKVRYESTDGCGLVSSSDGMTYQYEIPKGVCSIAFYHPRSKVFHRLTTFGYNEYIIKSVDPENQFPGEFE